MLGSLLSKLTASPSNATPATPEAGRSGAGPSGYAQQSAALSPATQKAGGASVRGGRPAGSPQRKGKIIGNDARVTVYNTASTLDLEAMGTAAVGDLVDINKAHASGWFTVLAKVQLSGGGEMPQYCNILGTNLDARTDFKALPTTSKTAEPTLANTGDAANPAAVDRATTYAEPPPGAELAVKGAGDAHALSPNDVRQGALGDCTFLASLRALVRANPALIQKTVKPAGAGRYAVTLFKDGKPQTVEVTHNMPSAAAGSPTYAQYDKLEPELWVLVMEKAYASIRGGYDKVGGSNQDAIEAITGKGAEYDKGYVYCDKSTEDQLLAYVNAALPAQPVFTSTRQGLKNPPHGIPDSSGGVSHAYSIEGVDTGGRKLDVMNPWGKSHVLGLPIADFKTYFLGCGTIKV